MSIKYVNTPGWLLVNFLNEEERVPLVPYLKVEFYLAENGKEYFKVLEGNHISKEGYVNQGDSNRFFSDVNPFLPEGLVHFVKNTNQLWYYNEQWIGPLNASTDASNPLPVGTFDLKIPDEPHGVFNPEYYYSTTWFPIDYETNNFLHPNVETSAPGCTVMDVAKWEHIYKYLIIRRKGDNKSVGTIKVFETENDREI
ncbi:hypothetical protein [Bacillus sp. TE8-1]|uniref:hypothetical protein n=1 Tax=Bacillus sp. TE8-1 TaxID=2217829 RepID=UPI0011EE1031|nr:hypothetical protein [Bacillus sp. TE8-1]KAA0780913.1 hypothetical protein DN404_00295 [Bacillus sp. TE8-1]